MRTLALSFAFAVVAGGASAQSADQILNDFRNGNDPLSQQMRSAEGQLVQQNMANPQVQSMYQQYLQAGSPYGQMTFPQFAYEYASHRFTREGMANRARQDGINRGNEYNAWRGVQKAEGQSAEALGAWQGGYRQNSSGMADVSCGLQQREDIYGGQTPVPYIEHGAPWVGSQSPPRQGSDGRWYQQAGDGNWYPMPGQ